MSVGERSKIAVENRLSELEHEYDGFAIHQTTWHVPGEQYRRVRSEFLNGYVVGVAVRIENDAGEALLVRERESDEEWSDPGGRIEPDETMIDGAVRVISDRLGIAPIVDGVEQATIVGVVDDTDRDAETVYRLEALFEGEFEGRVEPTASGDVAIEWRSDPPDLTTTTIS